MRDLQMTFYDVISILLPAVLVLAIVELHGLFGSTLLSGMVKQVTTAASTLPMILDVTMSFVVAYLLGHAINQITKYIQHYPRLRRLLIPTSSRKGADPEGKIVFARGSFPIVMERKIGLHLLDKLRDFYGIELCEQDECISDILFSTLPTEQANKRDIFIAIACMMRNTAFVAFVYALDFLYELLDAAWLQREVAALPADLLFLLLAVTCYFLFRRGFLQYEEYAEKLLYYAFLTAPHPALAVYSPSGQQARSKAAASAPTKPVSVEPVNDFTLPL